MAFKPDKTETLEGEIISLGEYRPWSFHKECGGNGSDYPVHSGKILDLKNKKKAGIDYFFDYLRKVVKSSEVIAVVPSSDSAKGPTSGVHSLATRLAKDLGLTNAGGCLVRHKSIAKKATGGDRSIGVDLASIRVDGAGAIKDKVVLLLDDVTTSGNSLLASKRLLMKAGAKEVRMVALARTVH